MAKKNRLCFVLLSVLILLAVFLFCVGCKTVKKSEEIAYTETTITTEIITSTEPKTEAVPTTVQTTTQLMYLNMGEFKLTAYCNCNKCCGKWAGGKTASGTYPKQGRTIAVDEDVIPFGSEVVIGGHTYTAEDCGGKVIGKHIDVYFENHSDANNFGVQYADVLLRVGKGE